MIDADKIGGGGGGGGKGGETIWTISRFMTRPLLTKKYIKRPKLMLV